MTSRPARPARLLLLLAVFVGLALGPVGPVAADEPGAIPDTTAPQIDLDPCFGQSPCRRVVAQVFGDLEPEDDLAVLGARIGDEVLAERIYDDGSGFVPEGSWFSYGNDAGQFVDYGLSVEVPGGSSDITFYARDLEGNTSELTTTVLGPVPPSRVRDLRVRRIPDRRAVLVRWRGVDLRSACCAEFTASTASGASRSCISAPPSFCSVIVLGRLTPGHHRVAVRATTIGGTGRAATAGVFIPRR